MRTIAGRQQDGNRIRWLSRPKPCSRRDRDGGVPVFSNQLAPARRNGGHPKLWARFIAIQQNLYWGACWLCMHHEHRAAPVGVQGPSVEAARTHAVLTPDGVPACLPACGAHGRVSERVRCYSTPPRLHEGTLLAPHPNSLRLHSPQQLNRCRPAAENWGWSCCQVPRRQLSSPVAITAWRYNPLDGARP